MSTIKINTEDLFQKMTHGEIFKAIKEAKSVIELRLKVDSVYEPTGIPERDHAHRRHLNELKSMLEKLVLVE